MAKVSMKLEGMDAALRALREAPEVFKKHISLAVGFSALRVAARARSLAPRDTGLLQSEIDHEHKDGTLTGHAGIRSGDAFYWRFLEFGTVKMAARPFFRPAAEEEQSGFIREVQSAGLSAEHELDKG